VTDCDDVGVGVAVGAGDGLAVGAGVWVGGAGVGVGGSVGVGVGSGVVVGVSVGVGVGLAVGVGVGVGVSLGVGAGVGVGSGVGLAVGAAVGVVVGVGVAVGGGAVGAGVGVRVGSGGGVGSGSTPAGTTVASRWMYATVGTRLIASMPGAFANPAALSISASPATGVPYRRRRSSASLARLTFAPTTNGAAGCCISTMTGRSESGWACMRSLSAGSILSDATVPARAGEPFGTRTSASMTSTPAMLSGRLSLIPFRPSPGRCPESAAMRSRTCCLARGQATQPTCGRRAS